MAHVGTVIWFLVYLFLFTPLSLAYRLFRPDPLKLRHDRKLASYWQERGGTGFRPMASRY